MIDKLHTRRRRHASATRAPAACSSACSPACSPAHDHFWRARARACRHLQTAANNKKRNDRHANEKPLLVIIAATIGARWPPPLRKALNNRWRARVAVSSGGNRRVHRIPISAPALSLLTRNRHGSKFERPRANVDCNLCRESAKKKYPSVLLFAACARSFDCRSRLRIGAPATRTRERFASQKSPSVPPNFGLFTRQSAKSAMLKFLAPIELPSATNDF